MDKTIFGWVWNRKKQTSDLHCISRPLVLPILGWTRTSRCSSWFLEKAEEPEIKLPISAGSLKNQESFRKTSISALLIMPKPLTLWITTNCGKFWGRWEYQTTWPAFEKSVCRSGSNSYNWAWNNRLFPNRKRSTLRLYIVTLLI